MAFCDLLLQRVYAHGIAQELISALNGLSTLLALPGFVGCGILHLREGHHVTRFSWCVIFVLNLIFYTIAAGALAWMLERRRVRRSALPTKTEASPTATIAAPAASL